jgi:antitoxin MazE
METALRKMGNSTGLILPKPILAALGVSSGTRMDVSVDDGRVIATPVRREVRAGWEADARAVAAEPLTEDARDWMAFGNEADADLDW